MQSRDVTLSNKLGLHARAAARFVQTASRFASDIHVYNKDKEVSGKSIMSIMMLAATKGSTLKITAAGPDEESAVTELVKLVEDRFGEDE